MWILQPMMIKLRVPNKYKFNWIQIWLNRIKKGSKIDILGFEVSYKTAFT